MGGGRLSPHGCVAQLAHSGVSPEKSSRRQGPGCEDTLLCAPPKSGQGQPARGCSLQPQTNFTSPLHSPRKWWLYHSCCGGRNLPSQNAAHECLQLLSLLNASASELLWGPHQVCPWSGAATTSLLSCPSLAQSGPPTAARGHLGTPESGRVPPLLRILRGSHFTQTELPSSPPPCTFNPVPSLLPSPSPLLSLLTLL